MTPIGPFHHREVDQLPFSQPVNPDPLYSFDLLQGVRLFSVANLFARVRRQLKLQRSPENGDQNTFQLFLFTQPNVLRNGTEVEGDNPHTRSIWRPAPFWQSQISFQSMDSSIVRTGYKLADLPCLFQCVGKPQN